MFTRPRLSQGGFRIAVIDACDEACAVTTVRQVDRKVQSHYLEADHGGRSGLTQGTGRIRASAMVPLHRRLPWAWVGG
jgi:hypothetical protein